MSQGKRTIEVLSDNELSCIDRQAQSNMNSGINKIKKPAKKRGRINVNACHRCRRDKKKCDGNHSTKEPCKYCRHHKVECTYPEPGRKRVKLIQPNVEDKNIKEIKKIKKLDIRKSSMDELCERMIKVEENLVDMTELLANVRHSASLDVTEITQQLFFRLLTKESTTIEQTILLRRLWSLIEKIMNCPTSNEDYFHAFYNRLQLLESDQEEIRSLMWKEVQNYVDGCEDTGSARESESLLNPTSSPYAVLPQTQPISPVPPEFDINNDLFADFSFEDFKYSTLNVTHEDNPLIAPIVPSQHSPNLQVKFLKNNQNIEQKDYQEGGNPMLSPSIFPNEVIWPGTTDIIDDNFNEDHFLTSPNLLPYIDSSPFSTISSHNNTPIDKEMEYFQHLMSEETNFLHFQETMTSPSFSNESPNEVEFHFNQL
ncbi:6176_t:CDS:1 [Funneliformis geosporum]|uniref:12269_t:CDS:1 n=1 Tax=Funneliformis geosporum TaxID=1117311 RepID=A0A9W4SWC3_9GLOM|nr:6176_t:CDS:1 [Funneliformis geosporum]CAI2184017.1 12269_t:CDS:1 [Funneliformis geosporum]